MKILKISTILLIVILGFTFRIYKINSAPYGMLVDEPNLAYNAYSILKTGRDEFGVKFPLSFKSYGDYKFPAYIYASILPIKIFGLNTFAVRFVSIISGTLLIFLIYLLLRELKFNYYHSLIGALITAVSPWTFILSRFAWESNLGLFIFTLGLLFFVKGISHKKIYFFLLAGLFFGLSWYCYPPYRLVSLSFATLFCLYLLLKRKIVFKYVVILFTILIITVLPLLPTITSKEGTTRLKQTSMFTNSQIAVVINENRTFCTVDQPRILCYLNSNKPLEYLRIIAFRFIDMFSLKYLFISGEAERYLSVENFGLFPFILIPFYLFGWIFLLRKNNLKLLTGFNIFLVLGLFISGLPSAITASPQRIQLSVLYPFMVILIIYGLALFEQRFHKNLYKALIILLILSGFIYVFNYANLHVRKYADSWGYVEKMMSFIGRQDKKTKVYLKPFFGEQLMYYAFYNKIDPSYYQKTAKLGEIEPNGFHHIVQIDNVYVTQASYETIACESKNLTSPIIYFTNDDLGKILKHTIKPIYIGKSTSGVLDLVYAYNAKDILSPEINCEK